MSASSDYKLSIKIAGELEKSLSSSIQSAQKMLNGFLPAVDSPFGNVTGMLSYP